MALEISLGGIPNSRNVLFSQIFLACPRAGNTSAGSAPKPPDLTWLCAKASQTFSGTFSGTLLNLTWLCTKASQTITRSISGTLFNLTWLCTKASQTFTGTFSGTFSGTLLNLTWLCTKAGLLRNPLWNLVELDLALHQSPFQELSRNLLRNPDEPHVAVHQNFLELLRDLLCTKASQTFPGTGALLNLTFAPKPPRPSLDLFPHLLWNLVEFDLALHESLPIEPGLGPHQRFPDLLLRTPLELTCLCTKAS